jgi:hypothetical protein
MRKLTRNLATGLVAGVLAAGAVLPALAQDAEEVSERPVATDHEPQQARVQARDAVRDPEMSPEERAERLAEREAFRAERTEQHRERIEAAVEAGDLTEEQAQQMLEARSQRAERGAGQRGPGDGVLALASVAPSRGSGRRRDGPR